MQVRIGQVKSTLVAIVVQGNKEVANLTLGVVFTG